MSALISEELGSTSRRDAAGASPDEIELKVDSSNASVELVGARTKLGRYLAESGVQGPPTLSVSLTEI